MPLIRNTALSLLQPHLSVRPDKTALICGERTLTYRQLWDFSQRFSAFLEARGIPSGSRVAIVLPDGFAYYYVFFGCLLSGVVPVLLSTLLSRDEYAFILRDAEARLLVTTSDSPSGTIEQEHFRPILVDTDALLEKALAVYPADILPFEPDSSDIAFMLYSSGSTGKPKGVPHRHGDILFTVETFGKQILRLTENDIVYSSSKLFFAYGFGNSLSFPLSAGASVVLFPGRPSPGDVLRIFGEHRPTVFFGVPSLYNLLLKTIENASFHDSLRLCISAGETLPASIFAEWKALTGLEIIDGIGSTELLHIFIANRPGAAIPGCSGTIIPPFEARIIGEDGNIVAPGEPGELLVRGASGAPYYWNRPDKTAATMLSGGWIRTGDIYTERDGYFFHEGRVDDLFKVDAQWVVPVTVENALRTHPDVVECAVVGRPLAGMLRPWAFVVLAPGHERSGVMTAALREHVRTRIPLHMVPVGFDFLDELPKTGTGKIQRFRLRDYPGQ